MAPQPLSPPTFATSQLSLLAAEQSAETSSTASLLSTSSPTTLSRAGLAITNLVIGAQRTGLGGKTVLELELDVAIGREGVLGEHGVRVGDIVRVGEQPRGGERKMEKRGMEVRGVEGVVVRVGERGVWVAVGGEEGGEGLGGRVWWQGVEKNGGEEIERADWMGDGRVKLANDVTYKRMNQTMERMQKMEEKDYTTLMRILFGLESPTPVAEGDEEVKFIDETLNESQRDAVRFALASREVALVHGPPGTGKTYTLIEIILQLVQRKKRILVCGPSNISVDNIVERLAPHKVPMIRLGHPARLLPSVLNHSLDVLTKTSEAAEIVKDVRKEMDAKQASIKKTRNGRERRSIYTDMKDLRKEYREREKQCVSTLVGGSQVVLATLHGAGGFQIRNEEFDVVIIDEASQALEAQCWIPLLPAKKVILAGDHLQLPPTIKSTPPKPKPKTDDIPTTKATPTLETTLFDRLLTLHGPSIKRMLKIQYRMHEKIMRFPSDNMYSSALTAAPSVAHRLLTDLPYPVKDTDDTREPLIFYDTQGGDFPETNSDSSSDTNTNNNNNNNSNENPTSKSKSSLLTLSSHSNPSEAALILTHITSLTTAGIHPSDIAIITPYAAQLTYLSQHLRVQESFPGLELGTVDGFQGREKEVVVISLVRSNGEGEVGFLREERRLNVGMTRARRGLVVVGDGGCVGRGSPFLKKWMEFLEEEADLRYPNVADLQGI